MVLPVKTAAERAVYSSNRCEVVLCTAFVVPEGRCGIGNVVPQLEEDISRAEWVEKERLPEYLEGTYPSIVEVFVSAGLL